MPRGLSVLSAAEGSMLVGLKSKDGEWLSLAGGWREGDQATLLIQLNNDREYPRSSLCTVLRSHLVEMLIRDQVRKLLFWNGAATPLSRLAAPVPALAVYLDAPTRGWRTVRAVARRMAAVAPPRFADRMAWLASLSGAWELDGAAPDL
jgi:hypothetical protein